MIEVLLLAAATAHHAQTDLVAAAAASGRPPECAAHIARSQRRPSNVWSSASVPNLQRYCTLIARAHARLSDNPDDALDAANKADALLPGRAAPQVVMGRAALREGKPADAVKAFAAALQRDPRAVEQPAAMHDMARARVLTGDLSGALATYRILVPRASLLASRSARARVLLEAAHVSMTVAASAEKPDLEEALAYLREASRDPHHELRLDVALSLVLALDRAGRSPRADAILAEQRSSAAWSGSGDYLVRAADLDLLQALALERKQPQRAAEHYARYLAGAADQGAFAAAARARAARLGSKR